MMSLLKEYAFVVFQTITPYIAVAMTKNMETYEDG